MNSGETLPDIDALIGTVRQSVRRRTGTGGDEEPLRRQVQDLTTAEGAADGGEFDESFYRALYPDVDGAVASGAYASGRDHWLRHGQAEGRLGSRSLAHAAAAGRARLAGIATAAARIGQLPAAPETLRARLGAQAVQVLGRTLAWYSAQLKQANAAVSAALAEQLSEIEMLAARAQTQREQLATLAGFALAGEDEWQARCAALAQSQSGWETRLKLLARQLGQVEDLVRQHEARVREAPTRACVGELQDQLKSLKQECGQLSKGQAKDAAGMAALEGRVGAIETAALLQQAGLKDRFAGLRQELEQLQSGMQPLMSGALEAKTESATLRQELEQLQSDLQPLTSGALEAKTESVALRQELEQLQNDLQMLTSGALEAKTEGEALRRELDQLRSELQPLISGALSAKLDAEALRPIERTLAELTVHGKMVEGRLAEEIQARDRLAGRLTAESLARQIAEERLRAEVAAREKLEAQLQSAVAQVEALARAEAEQSHWRQSVEERLSAVEATGPRLEAAVQAETHARQVTERRWQAEVAAREQLSYRVEAVVQQTNQMHATLADTSRNTQQTRGELAFQQQRVSMLLEETRRRLPEPLSAAQLGTLEDAAKHDLDAFYAAFEDLFRGSRSEIKERQRVYLPYIRKALALAGDGLVADLGCGRGEWLELLVGEAIAARGADLNLTMIERCRALGLEVEACDALEYLRAQPEASLAAVTGFHIVEHISFRDLLALFDESLRRLRPGGVVIFETPDPANVLVGANTFYNDPTHLRPLPSDMLRYIAEVRGFCRVDVLRLHPDPAGSVRDAEATAAIRQIEDYFWGPRDYAIIGWKA